jgi:hypothetical protein
MSDLEVYKGLGCCKRNKCDECPYKKYSTYGCKDVLLKDAEHSIGRLMRELKDAKAMAEQLAGKANTEEEVHENHVR